ncbi:MAG TPA: hypothetical protein VK066_23150 [Chloroflexota bacterium]|nr:hypothetical protein [Chloroflexota bacterium]
MVRRALSLALLALAACSAPQPGPPPTPPAAAVAPTAPATLSVAPPTAAAPSTAVVAEPTAAAEPPAPGEAPLAEATSAPAEPAPVPSAVTPLPSPPTPTAVALEAVTPPDEIGALAGAGEASTGPVGGPTAAVLPPSARLQIALTPTPNVLASSPSLGSAVQATGSADYAGAIKLAQDSRKSPGAARLSERIDAAVARAQAAGSTIEVEGWQASLKGSTEVYEVTFVLRENRQGLRAEWEVNLTTGEVRPMNQLAEALDAT